MVKYVSLYGRCCKSLKQSSESPTYRDGLLKSKTQKAPIFWLKQQYNML